MTAPPVLWTPPDPGARATQLESFIDFAEARTGQPLRPWARLHAWSVTEFRAFWALFLEWARLPVAGELLPVCVADTVEHATFFPDARLNYAAALLARLQPGDDDVLAVIGADESGREVRLTRGRLRTRVGALRAALAARGLRAGDRVVAIARNLPEAIVAALAATSLGAVWSSVSPDLATEAVLARFRQLEPTLLFADLAWSYQGQPRPLDRHVAAVRDGLPTLRGVIALEAQEPGALGAPVPSVDDLVRESGGGEPPEAWPRFPFNHPLFVLFSSGTTGPPKCIVHGAGGTLLEHMKEHRLHTDLGPGDLLYFHTSCGWMMWNWQLSALASGAAIAVYDGSVAHPAPDALLQLVDRLGVTVFGTSPAYLQFLKDSGVVPRERVRLDRLRAVQSTGSILFPEQFAWIAEAIKPVPVHSISGGTDIIGCFVLGNPSLPVHAGESQCVSLGYDVRAMTDAGPVTVGSGELVCCTPFPSRPVGLFGDATGERFHAAYFAQHPGVWTHGDFIRLTDRGSARILGRSDGTLNVLGIRIGPAEIHEVVRTIPGVTGAMALEQEAPREPGGSRLVLLVTLAEGQALDRALTLRIKRELRERASPHHVPAVVVQVSGLPVTLNGKLSERAARDVINGREASNRNALRNPEVLDELRAHPGLRVAP